MKLKELLEILDGTDPEIEVVIEARGDEIEDGDILNIEGESSITIQYGKLTIIGDVSEDE